MILIITHKQDFTADFLVNKLNENQISYLRLNCEDLLSSPEYFLGNDDGFELNITGYKNIRSVWYRRTQVPDLPDLKSDERVYFFKEFDILLENIYHSLYKCTWLSNPFNIKLAESKLLQLKKAKEVGFSIPKTLITNSKQKLKEFYFSNKKTIIKPIYSGYIPNGGEMSLFYTSIITDKLIEQLTDFDLTPCIYQEYIEKEYEVRLTIVNSEIFSAKVDSQKNEETFVDWRKGKLDFTACIIPLEIANKCVLLCNELGIVFGAIDLIKTKTGEYVFLEINPNGQWAWIEMETGLKISDAIIKYLI